VRAQVQTACFLLEAGQAQRRACFPDGGPMKATATRQTLSASSLIGDTVRNGAGEKLGEAKELMIDLPTGRIAYAVLSFGGFLGVGDKLFAVPWSALALDEENRQLVLDVSKEVLEAAPGFDKNNWPDMADPVWGRSIYEYYNQTYWE
jgi:sporulation protein YlmC with PRC-barrel domain